MQHHLVEIPPFSFWVHESGSGTPLILLHGLGGSSEWWRRNVEALAAEHRVLAVDLVGFGRNRLFLRRSRLPLPFDDIAGLLARWVDQSLHEPVHVTGNSMGGQIAIHFAAARPDLVRSLVLVDSSGIPFRFAPAEHLRNILLPRGFISFVHILLRDALRAGPTSMIVALSRLLRDDVRPLIRELRIPTLLVWGERDPLVPLAYGKQMLSLIPGARLEIIPGAAHVPMWENAPRFNETLLQFFRQVDRRTPQEAEGAFSWGLTGWTDGIAHREAGRRRDVVLIHGLGMSSAYFEPFAHALFDRGFAPIAPDLPGFGESVDAPSGDAAAHARVLAQWADAAGIHDALWIGHSLGCNAVAHLLRDRPDLARSAACIGPLWSPRSAARLLGRLMVDAWREPPALFAYVIRAYWRTGLGRWFTTFRRFADDLRGAAPAGMRMFAGQRDPLPDRDAVRGIIDVPGAHACHFAHAEAVAEVLTANMPLDDVAGHQHGQGDGQRDQGSHELPRAARDSE